MCWWDSCFRFSFDFAIFGALHIIYLDLCFFLSKLDLWIDRYIFSISSQLIKLWKLDFIKLNILRTVFYFIVEETLTRLKISIEIKCIFVFSIFDLEKLICWWTFSQLEIFRIGIYCKISWFPEIFLSKIHGKVVKQTQKLIT